MEASSTQRVNAFRLRFKIHFHIRLVKVLALIVFLGGMAVSYNLSGTSATLRVNGQTYTTRVHQLPVEAILLQIGLALKPEDEIWPPLGGELMPGQPLELHLARPVIIDVGQVGHLQPRTIYTLSQSPVDIYHELGIELSDADDVYVNGTRWGHANPLPVTLPPLSPHTVSLKARLEALRPRPVRLVLHRAVPIHVIDGELRRTIFTTDQTVGDFLVTQNIPLYLGDAIVPDVSEPLTPDSTVVIERSVPVSIQVDGAVIKTRTRRDTVGQVVAQEGIALVGQDYTIPPETSPVPADADIAIVRVVEALEIDRETTDFETVWVADPNLELDVQRVQQEGQQGVAKTRTRVRYENGQEVSRVEEETWLESSAADKVIAYGTKVVIRTLETPEGKIEYWRKIRMLATGYSAATSGKTKDHPTYGITRTGMKAGYGVVAVDPGVISLRSDVYVPGYGVAVAGDTGGAILGKRIDLGFDEDMPPPWYKWVDVYLLTPPPPLGQIRYVLPQWPQ
jgi:uncharacterized protein YabE (DUF348 family)